MFSAIRGNYSWHEKEDQNFILLRNELCREFIEDNVPSDFISLNSVYQNLPKAINDSLKSINKRYGHIDSQLIQSSLNWMIREKFWDKVNEFPKWIVTWTDIFNFTMEKLQKQKPRREDYYKIPDMWDRWVFNYLAVLITRIEDRNITEKFWTPILEMGNPYHHYIEDFLKSWFINYFKHIEIKDEESIKQRFIECWKAMIDFALHSETWKFNDQSRWYHIEEMALALMGLDRRFSDFWLEELHSLVESMKGYYKLWIDEYLVYTSCAVGFINFLRQPAAIPILLEGIIWVRNGYEKYLSFWEEKDIFDPLSHLLNTIWIKHQQKIRKNKDSFEAFQYLLNKLVEQQNPIALEIFQQV